jgi:DNA-directed RNA polymerase subunit RPC12/RpoP
MAHKTPSGKSSKAWADFERVVAAAYRDAGFKKAKRITRGSDFGASRPDVSIPEIPNMMLDMKYRNGGWQHHTTYTEEIHKRYVKGQPGHFGVMHTKSGGETGSFVTVTLATWLEVLAKAYLKSGKSDEWSCPRCGNPVEKQAQAVLNLYSYKCSNCSLEFISEDNANG